MGTACSAVKETAEIKLNNHEESVAKQSSHRRTKGSIFSSGSSDMSSSGAPPSEHLPRSVAASPNPIRAPSTLAQAMTPPVPPPALRPCPSLTGSKIPGLAMDNLPVDVQRAVWGRMDAPLNPPSKDITIFHCAHLTDSHVERDMLLEQVYPALTMLCAEHGCELHLVDNHWGLLDESVDHHRPREILIQCIQDICARDKNAITTIFLNEKYGMFGCPMYISMDHFNNILAKTSDTGKELLTKWYSLDEYMKSPSYKLQPISTHIPSYRVQSSEGHWKAWQEWTEVSSQISDLISGLASEMEFLRPYLVSDLEEEIRSLFTSGINTENMIFIHRTFNQADDVDLKWNDPKVQDYFDVLGGKRNEAAQPKLKNLVNMMNSRLEPSHRMDFQVPWNGAGINPKVKEHGKYLDQLCQSYRQIVTEVLDRVLAVKNACDKLENQVCGQGLSSVLFSELQHHTTMCYNLSQTMAGQPKLLTVFDHYIALGHPHQMCETVRPLVLHSRTGAGCSSHAALFTHNVCSVKGWERAVCVARFVGASPDCENLEQVLCSISQHICYVCNLPMVLAHQKPENFPKLLQLVPQSLPLVIVIDGLNHLSPSSAIDWVPQELPKHLRMVLTMHSNCDNLTSLKHHLVDNEYIHEIASPGRCDIPHVLNSIATSLSICLPDDQRQQIIEHTAGNPLCLVLAVYSTSVLPREKINFSEFMQLDIEEQVQTIFDGIETKYDVVCVAKVVTYLSLARHGLSSSEMDDLLSCDKDVIQKLHPFNNRAVHRIPGYLWTSLRLSLKPMLLERTCKNTLLLSWKHQIFKTVALERYKSIIDTARESLIDYFQGKWGKGKKTSPSGKAVSQSKHAKLVKPQPNMYKEIHNHRKLSELPYHLFHSRDKQALQKCVLNAEFLSGKLCSLGIYHMMQDLHSCLVVDPENQQYKHISAVLEKSRAIMAQSGLHFSSQLFLQVQFRRAKKDKTDITLADNKLLHDLTIKSPIPFLVPSRLEDTNVAFGEEYPKAVIQKLIRIPGDSAHMVSVAPDLGEVKVWNVHTQQVVRTLSGLSSPKDAKMIDSYRCVVLCNRELKIYNLDKGTLEAELKGVLNMKMPFYGIHTGGEHVVALSRNRMCINIVNITSGDTVATFKVGEDRFLNSLLISQDGQICVCGDEVQKPFPLLVWDLQQRKLVHDLRIQGHEFITRISAITSNGHYVVCCCKELEDPYPNFLIVYDLQSGALFKKWKPECNTTGVAISFEAGVVVSALEDGSLLVWDLVTGSLKHNLRGPGRGADVVLLSVDGTRCATYDSSCRDTSVCLWDVTKGQCLGTIATELGVTCGEISADGSLLMVGHHGMNDLICLKPYSKKRNSQPDESIYGDASRKTKVFNMLKPSV